MTYRPDKRRNIKRALFSGAIVVFLVYTVLFTRVFDAISRGVVSVALPIWRTQESMGMVWENMRAAFALKRSLVAENARLKEDVEIAGAKLLDRNLLLEENAELKERAGREIGGQTVFAMVMAKPNRSLYDTLIIDVGENAGVKAGDRVLYGGSIVIGKVVEVFERSSKVVLLSSPREAIDVIVGKSNIVAVAYGRGGGNFELSLPRDMEIEEGDVASIPGMTPQVLGTVEHIETKPSDPFKKILLKGPVDIFALKWVEVAIYPTTK